MIVFMYIRQREPAKIVSKEWKLTIVFLQGLNVVSPDGNKRIGTHAMLVFLDINQITLSYEDDDLIETILRVASGTLDYNGLLGWLQEHLE